MFDVHVHAAPDVTPRLADDREVVAAYAAAGFTGCVLKGHYESTVGRAAAAGRGQSIRVYGGIALNQHVGGVNPAAVAACLGAGGRVVWMPTADSHTQRSAGLPRLCGMKPGLSEHTYAIAPVDWSTTDEVGEICRMIAEADAVLATGHISTAEARWLLAIAHECGVRRVLLTHPSYTVPAMSSAEAAELTEQGALAEITTFQLLHQTGCTPSMLAAFAREVGLDRIVLSSDAGQPDSPTPPEALELLIDVLAREGLDRSALRACASELPEALVVP
ncbi:hypothetical protein E1202_28975 [Saccharopolyspora karakumensis]|uniref:Histidinol phosphatase n=1 Tax=Saccharopolyspora karakumensis TaxID=2530386 RepID=A0A4R5BA66_9PSEU|nr:DUF6282 family protein [Saccharopolyspora karakumensis]TDD81496.1 hypothetical protein E1202_28975 [Saccharopolyspora karakumensis]